MDFDLAVQLLAERADVLVFGREPLLALDHAALCPCLEFVDRLSVNEVVPYVAVEHH